MKHQLIICNMALAALLAACSSPEMEAVAARVQKIRVDNALNAKAARVRIWKDTSSRDQHGWHLQSQQENRFTLPDNEFRMARYLVATQAYTTWHESKGTPTPLMIPEQQYIIELEWLNNAGVPTGAVNVPAICRESQLGGIITSDFPLVLPDNAYEQFFALPTISKALDSLRD